MVNKLKIKVGLFGRFPPEDSPIATYQKNLVDNLKKKCNVVTIGLGNSNCDYRMVINKNFARELGKIIEKEKLDILHIQYIASSKHFAQTSKFMIANYFNTILANIRLLNAMDAIKIPKVITLHELNIESKNIKKIIVKWLEKKVIEKSNKVIVFSPFQKGILVHHKINAEHIYFGLTSRNVIKKGGKNILYLGTIHPDRGIYYLLKAMELLPDYKLVIKGVVADDSYGLALRNEILKNKLENVTLGFGWGNETERDKLYRWGDIVVLPYLWAPNQSSALHNAFAYRIPVVVTDTNGPIDETVRESKCGVIVEMKNPQKLAEGIKIVHQSYQNYITNVDKYRKIANWVLVADKHIEVYKEVMGA